MGGIEKEDEEAGSEDIEDDSSEDDEEDEEEEEEGGDDEMEMDDAGPAPVDGAHPAAKAQDVMVH
jgi:histone chaperone ASF1